MLRVLAQMQPRHAFFRKYVSCWLESRSLIECADMKMHFRRAFAFARQGGPAPCAETAQPAGRRVELRYLTFGDRIGVTPECHEHGDRRTAMLATALAMAPRHRIGSPVATNRTAPQRHPPSTWLLISPIPPRSRDICRSGCSALRAPPQSASRRLSTRENRLRTVARRNHARARPPPLRKTERNRGLGNRPRSPACVVAR